MPEPPTRAELLTNQFYEWERRGRGWTVWDAPVRLEPPFRPFWFHEIAPHGIRDDASRPTGLSTLAAQAKERVLRFAGVPARLAPNPAPPSVEEPLPELDVVDFPVVELAVTLSPEEGVSRSAMEQCLLSLRYAEAPIAFEIIGTHASVVVQFAVRGPAAPRVIEQLRAHFPRGAVRERQAFFEGLWHESEDRERFIAGFGLSHEFMLPLRIPRGFEVDPLIAVVGAIADLNPEELGLIQVLFEETREPWVESVLRVVTDGTGGGFFADAPDLVAQARAKVSRPLFAAVVKIAAQSPAEGRAREIASALTGALSGFENPTGNSLIALENDAYPAELREWDLITRRSHRSGMLLNVEELVSLVHLPSASVQSERLVREVKKTKAAPALAVGHPFILGQNAHYGRTLTVGLGTSQRLRHAYVIGASGTGKSTLLLNMILQDLRAGNGCAVLDAHGDLIDWILGHVPEERVEDVVLFDPSDEEYPVGFNILQAHSEIEKQLLASDLVSVFRRLSTTWGDQMTSVLGNGILAFLESAKGGTLADLRRFFVEPEYRDEFLLTVQDPDIVYYWQREFPLLTGRPQAPLLTRLDTFLRPKLIRNMVGQARDTLDFRWMMDQRKIFLGKLAQGAIGEENAYLLGTLVVAKLHQMALGRQNVPEAERQPFYVYIDEFHNFITPSIASILSGARKFGMGLILSHQELRQVVQQSPEVASAVIANPATRICFRLGDEDAKRLQGGFTSFDARDLQSLGVGEAIARVERAEYDFTLETLPLPDMDPDAASGLSEKIREQSRARYARRKGDVERELAAARPNLPGWGQASGPPPRTRFGPPRPGKPRDRSKPPDNS